MLANRPGPCRRLLWLLPVALIGCAAGCLINTYSTRQLGLVEPMPQGSNVTTGIVTNNVVYPGTLAAMPPGSEPKDSGETYAAINENAFRQVAQHPLSTFSIDVDTASYSNVRRFLTQDRKLPEKDAVRIEEMVNYFSYDYPVPHGEHPVALALDVSECPWNRGHQLVRIGLAARTFDRNQLPPRNFVFLVDTSGSMNEENRLPLLRKSLRMLVEQMTARDRVALVSYAGEAGLVLDSTPGNEQSKIRRAIDNLSAGGSTNGGEGITLAYKIARKHFIRDGINRVILGTDGDFNVGVTDQSELVKLIEEQRASGVYLSLLGFGMGNLKDATLEKLAHHGNGHYAYVDSEKEARKIFVEQGAALVTVAKDVKLQVEFNPARVGAYRLIGYENRLLRNRDFNDDKKDAGDVGAGHSVTALYEIVPPGQPIEGGVELRYASSGAVNADSSAEWLTVKVRYKHPEGEKSKLLAKSLTGSATPFTAASVDVRFAAAVAAFGMVLRESECRGDADLGKVREWASSALGQDRHGHRREFVKLVEAAARLSDKPVPRR